MQPDETTEQFVAFICYRDMSPRSATAVAEKCNLSASYIEKLSARFSWVERTRAWLAELDRANQAAQKDAVVAMNTRHAQLASVMQSKIVERLSAIDVSKLSARDLATWLDVSVRIERTARGEATEILSHRFSQMSDTELIAFVDGSQIPNYLSTAAVDRLLEGIDGDENKE
jgi:hypothetical protein